MTRPGKCPVRGCDEPRDTFCEGVWTCVEHMAPPAELLAAHLRSGAHGIMPDGSRNMAAVHLHDHEHGPVVHPLHDVTRRTDNS